MKQRPQKHRLKTSLRADQTYLMASETKRRLQSFLVFPSLKPLNLEPFNPKKSFRTSPQVGRRFLVCHPLLAASPPIPVDILPQSPGVAPVVARAGGQAQKEKVALEEVNQVNEVRDD